MTDVAPEQSDAAAQGQDDKQAETTAPTVEELQAKIEEVTRESRKWESRAKENSGAAKAAEQARLAAMSETERAIEEARQAARSEAATEYGKRLARTEFDAAAGRRNPEFETAKALQYLDLSTLLDENGEPNAKAIQAAVADLVPAPNTGPPSLDGGARTNAPVSDFNQELRRAAGRA